MSDDTYQTEIRLLTVSDAAHFREIRLRALQDSPQAFGSSYEEFLSSSLEEIEERLRTQSTVNGNFILAAFHDGKPVGMVGFRRETGLKTQHKGMVWGTFVAPEARGHGVSRRLMERHIEMSRSIPGLEQLHLSVVISQEPARQLYLSLGFNVYGLEPRALKVGVTYHDEELMMLMLAGGPAGQP